MIVLPGKKSLGGKGHYIAVAETGEEIMSELTKLCVEEELDGAALSGLGAVEDIKLGLYNPKTKSYDTRSFETTSEMVSFNGNISIRNNELFLHAHAAFADENFQMFGGHLFSATVVATAEFVITPLGVLGEREHSENIGIDLLCKTADR